MKTQAAFPNIGLVEGITVPWKISDEARSDGMSLRDYFAAKALQGLYFWDSRVNSGVVYSEQNGIARLAKDAYKVADAMLEARKDSNVHNSP